MSATSPFLNVPVEILLRISFFLTTTELNTLRLTCRGIESWLFPSYAQEFFSKKQFMLTAESLQALVDISNSRLAHHLKHIIIGLDCYIGGQFNIHNRLRQTLFCEGYHAQQALIWTGQAGRMLTEAFRNLKPTTVGLRDYYSDARRGRDGGNACWASYGATTVLNQTGVSLLMPVTLPGAPLPSPSALLADEWPSKVFLLVMSSLGAAEAHPEAIEMLSRRCHPLRALAFHLPGYLHPTVTPVLRNLRSLFLALDLTPDYNPNVHHVPVPMGGVAGAVSGSYDPNYVIDNGPDAELIVMERCPDFPLRMFLGHLSNLQHLRLNFGLHRTSPSDFLTWLGSPVPANTDTVTVNAATTTLPRQVDPVSLPKLEKLDLGHVVVSPHVVLRLLRKFAPTLRRLELWRVSLEADYPDTVGYSAGDGQLSRDPPNLWAWLLKNMRAVPLQLHHLMIGHPSQRARERRSHHLVRFALLEDTDNMRAYTGMDWKRFVEELESDMRAEFRQWLADRRPPGGEDTAMNDSEEEYEEGSEEE